MPNLINTSYSTSNYYNSRQKEREEEQAGGVRGENKLSANERAELLRKEREEKMQTEKAQEESPQRGDYRGLIDRVAEQDAKMAKYSAYTQGQQQLLKQVENTISPNSERSYDFKV
ncbi:hypothetical protein LRP49_18380 [Enterovibrio sp. ZSDZ35]|uniref:Uncharacterized protein n=1 Tax=Enterovibrio qingdaonensis TaxID=2899818 RepID=A0ABT5QQ80_9GAMM|nr:hypothetical protein [Enterovibrio sp. ZSDZ35]MDD1783137.1 hypothetical protein [Enterovibrio sp. ZSDZ35]